MLPKEVSVIIIEEAAEKIFFPASGFEVASTQTTLKKIISIK